MNGSPTEKLAIIEMAVASGLVLLTKEERDPLQTSTYGTGLLIKHAIEKGARKIILGVGGSATNDAGLGLAMALGFTFKDRNNQVLPPSGASMLQVHSIIAPAIIPRVQFEIACDVTNFLYGKKGAAFVYAAQKGAGKKAVAALDGGLQNIAKIIRMQTNTDISKIKGLGAAGGVAAMIVPYFTNSITSGISMVLAKSGLQKQLKNGNLLITGEGRIDEQSVQGKVVGAIIQLAKAAGVEVLLVCGQLRLNNAGKNRLGGFKTISIAGGGVSEKRAIAGAANLLNRKVAAYFRNLC